MPASHAFLVFRCPDIDGDLVAIDFHPGQHVWRIADRCVQLLGGLGVSDETIVASIFKDIRPFRIYDGPSEVHRWSLGRRIARRDGPVPT